MKLLRVVNVSGRVEAEFADDSGNHVVKFVRGECAGARCSHLRQISREAFRDLAYMRADANWRSADVVSDAAKMRPDLFEVAE